MHNYDERVAEDRTATAPNGSREERLARLDQMERDIAAERERLNRPEPDTRERPESRMTAGSTANGRARSGRWTCRTWRPR